jgi:hypothetical protein
MLYPLEYTEVATSVGDKAISNIEVGDEVLAYDEETGEMGNFVVQATLRHTDSVIIHLTIDGKEIEPTPEHPFLVKDRGWVTAGALAVGDLLRNAQGEYGPGEAIRAEQRSQTMYNLTVEEAQPSSSAMTNGWWIMSVTLFYLKQNFRKD